MTRELRVFASDLTSLLPSNVRKHATETDEFILRIRTENPVKQYFSI